jgi:hypothetical protein
MELETRKVAHLENKINDAISEINFLDNKVNVQKEIVYFTERCAPVITHLSIMEGLHSIVNSDI